MAFVFTLESVLRYRRSLEERQKLILRTLYAQRAALEGERRRLRERRRTLWNGVCEELQTASPPPAELQLASRHIAAMETCDAALGQQLATLQRALLEQVKVCREYRQKREALEMARAGQMRAYEREQQRREQARLDESHLLRKFARPRTGKEKAPGVSMGAGFRAQFLEPPKKSG